jgi:serine/threonine protein kinase
MNIFKGNTTHKLFRLTDSKSHHVIRPKNATSFNFVLDYLECGSLNDVIVSCVSLSDSQKKLYLFESAIALWSLHSVGIVYCNLSPEHILIRNNGHIQLIDFSKARDSSDRTVSWESDDLCSYSAPELILNRDVTYAVDWWALGVIAYQLFVGRLPFRGADQRIMSDMIVNGSPKIPGHISHKTHKFISGLLKKRPEERLGSGDLDEILKCEFFAGFDMSKAMNLEYVPDYVPEARAWQSESETTEKIECESVVDLVLPGFSWSERDLIIQSFDGVTSPPI